MSAAGELRERLAAAGVTLSLEGGCNLRLKGTARPAPDLMAEIKRHKPALIALLQGEAANDPGEPPPADAEADPERAAIEQEEYAPLTPPAEHLAAVRALQRVASPMPGSLLAGVRDAYACGRCGRGIWISPSWPGALPTVCRECEMGERP